MAVRYVKDFQFPSAAGYSDSKPSKVTGQMYAKGGPAKAPKGMMVVIGIGKPKGEAPMEKAKGGKVAKVMHEFGEGKLHSGSKKGPEVTNPKQAIAIALSEAGKAKKAKGGMAHEDVAADKSLIKSMVKPGALKKAMGGPAVQMAKSNAIESSLKGQKKTGYADGGMASPLQQLAPRAVPVAPRSPMIPPQAAPAAGGPRIGVGRSRSGKPNVGAIRAAMAKAATKSMPENAPEVMKKGGKVC